MKLQNTKYYFMYSLLVFSTSIDSNNNEVSNKLSLNLNLRPQNLDFDTYYKLTIEYEKLRS